MEKYFNMFTVFFGALGGFFAHALGGYDSILNTVLCLTVIDMITGLINGFYNKKLNSHKCVDGIIKKVYIYITIGFAVVIDNWLHHSIPLREVVITFYIVNEGLSILENIGKVIPYPDKLKELFEQLKDGGVIDGK